jgi:hypothetical protein
MVAIFGAKSARLDTEFTKGVHLRPLGHLI